MACKEVAVLLKNRVAFYANINLDINTVCCKQEAHVLSQSSFFLNDVCVYVCCLHIYLCAMFVHYPRRPEEEVGSSEAGVNS